MRLPLLAFALAACAARDVQVIAHRGASWDAPEHSFAAYDLALRQGADWIEQDLQMTRDGQLVVFHDDSLDRTARGPAADCAGLVRDKTLAQLRRCEIGSWFNEKFPGRARPEFSAERIPTLAEVIERYGDRARFYIETKNPAEAPGMEDSLLVLLRKHGLAGAGADRERVLVQSFSPASLERLHALEPELRLVQLWEDPIPAAARDSTLKRIAEYAVGFGPSRRILNADLVRGAQRRGLVVHPYTVNDEPVMSYMLELGVDGMFTDRPALLLRLLGR
ncbi:MAG: glycerophosphodiester phosphodiesterase [Gemmatimonadaceae bacterium]|nr:glycerophosphodiester phosphodiesterase [Gemmatimonadaceae bacterium]MCW5827287.1 glycerophosphodiester phosphodiesterase [Gemmatimonadaceae bacterium]